MDKKFRFNVADNNQPDYRVRVVENSEPNQDVITNPDPGFYRPTNGQNGDQIVISNPDPGFYLPTNQNSNNGGYEPISSGPALVEGSRPNYPPKQYPSPYARDGK
ncbi:uncharacterized protein LOC131848970 [Achroia grisella]|uniref:uncharacterized protein LOC131848970 n=1 Tax=Achroia grisella TaxID=688607 RepID=UPI0027D2BB60|nr:uncharacterized protein LOC131848970 [Achroia grisella]